MIRPLASGQVSAMLLRVRSWPPALVSWKVMPCELPWKTWWTAVAGAPSAKARVSPYPAGLELGGFWKLNVSWADRPARI